MSQVRHRGGGAALPAGFAGSPRLGGCVRARGPLTREQAQPLLQGAQLRGGTRHLVPAHPSRCALAPPRRPQTLPTPLYVSTIHSARRGLKSVAGGGGEAGIRMSAMAALRVRPRPQSWAAQLVFALSPDSHSLPSGSRVPRHSAPVTHAPACEGLPTAPLPRARQQAPPSSSTSPPPSSTPFVTPHHQASARGGLWARQAAGGAPAGVRQPQPCPHHPSCLPAHGAGCRGSRARRATQAAGGGGQGAHTSCQTPADADRAHSVPPHRSHTHPRPRPHVPD